jgi:hypothetical protein
LCSGCIPLFIDKYLYPRKDYRDVFQPWKSKLQEVQWRRGHELPFPWVRSMHEFELLYDELLLSGPAGLARLDLMQRETLEWWAAAKRHFIGIYERGVCSFDDAAAVYQRAQVLRLQ